MEITELHQKLEELRKELDALGAEFNEAAHNLDVDRLMEINPRRAALYYAITIGDKDLHEMQERRKREKAQEIAERSRFDSSRASEAQQRTFHVRAAREVKQRVEHWKEQQKNLPAFGASYQEEQERKAQAELDKLVTQWNIREEEL